MSRNLTISTVPDNGLDTQEFIQAQTAASRVFGRDKDAKIIFEGNSAYVRSDGAICYPSLAEGSRMTKENVLVSRGYADHESSHKRYTHMNTVKKFIKDCEATDNGLLRSTANAVEDLRVDHLAIRDYSGAKANLEATCESVYNEFLEAVEENPELGQDFNVTMPLMITAEGRKRMGYNAPSIQKTLDVMTPEQRSKIEAYVDLAIECRNPDPLRGTKETIAVSKAIVKAKAEGDAQEESGADKPKSSGESSDDSSGDGGDEPESDEGDDEGDGDDGGESDGDDESDTDPTETDSSDTDIKLGGSSNPIEFDDMRERSLTKTFKNHVKSSDDTYRPFSTEHDQYSRLGDSTSMGKHMASIASISMYEDEVRKLSGKTSTMARKLERALLSTQKRDWEVAREVGVLDPKRLSRVVTGSRNVFRMREDRKEVDTAVSVMIDLSGSMHGREVLLAKQVAIALSLVMEKAGVSYEVLGFNNYYLNDGNGTGVGAGNFSNDLVGGSSVRKEFLKRANEAMLNARRSRKSTGGFSRYEPVQVYEFKGFDKRLVQERLGLGVIGRLAGGHNSDSEAVSIASGHLKRRPEKKKILFVLSDGQPAVSCDFGTNHLAQHLRNQIEQVGKHGIDCVGIGIRSEAVKHFYPNYVVVNNLDDLPKQAFDQLARLLVGDRFKVDNSELMGSNKAR